MISEREERPTAVEGGARRLDRLFLCALLFLIVSAYPGFYAAQGFRFARSAADHGISVDMRVGFDGFGCSAAASQAALDGKIPMDRGFYDWVADGRFQEEYRVTEGVSGFFFSLGVKLGRAPPPAASRLVTE